jgi:mono/diheme cytochrome c family protein
VSSEFPWDGVPSVANPAGETATQGYRYVGVIQMGGHGTFAEPRTGVRVTHGTDDLITRKLPALEAYQLSLHAPSPPAGSFDAAAARRGKALFEGKAGCSGCHEGPRLTDANRRLHAPGEVVSEPEAAGVPSYASRSATKQYRTTPLHGAWQHPPYFHNGSAPTLAAVVETYNGRNSLHLDKAEIHDLAQYLESL